MLFGGVALEVASSLSGSCGTGGVSAPPES